MCLNSLIFTRGLTHAATLLKAKVVLIHIENRKMRNTISVGMEPII